MSDATTITDQEDPMSQSAPAVDPWLRRAGMPGLKGKNVLVTGGTSGIGQATAVRFAEHGANVAINYLTTPDEAAGTEEQVIACLRKVQQHGVRNVLVQGDVSSERDVVRMVGEASERLGGLDVLVNNAGIQISRPSDKLASAEFDRVLAVNLRGAFLCAREVIRRFLADEKPGALINVSSVHEAIPRPSYLSYSISKGGVGNLTRTLALEYAGRGIRVNGIAPGATITPINRAWTEDPSKTEIVSSHIPLGRAGTADEMAGVCAFLASDDAAYITGQTVFIDGGLTLYADFREPWSAE
jgi:glucose 1-dehydrogenase